MHIGIKEYECHDCSNAFPSMNGLNKHVTSVHLKILPFKCCICKDKAFTSKSNLQTLTKSIHLQEKNQLCLYCEKAFSLYGNLKKHISREHLKLSTFKCDFCDKAYPEMA